MIDHAATHRTLGNLLWLLAALAGALGGFSPGAGAHTMLDSAKPRVGAVLRTTPHAIVLHFDARIDLALSWIHLQAEDGTPLQVHARHSDAAKGDLAVSIPPLPAGVYRVQWRAFGVDGHLTHGDYRFTIRPAEATAHEQGRPYRQFRG